MTSSNITLHDLFINLFIAPKKVERNESFERNVYEQAHNEFMNNVLIIEDKIPSIKDGYEDEGDLAWYDELREDIIEEYSDMIENIS